MTLKYQLGDCEVLVEVFNVVYEPPVDKWLANSDWECYGTLEFDWDVVEITGELEDYDEDYVDSLLRKDIMDIINSRDEEYYEDYVDYLLRKDIMNAINNRDEDYYDEW